MEVKQALLWCGLLLTGQTTDTITTEVDRLHGALELMPVSRLLLYAGGIDLLWAFKLVLVVAATAVLLVAARAVRPQHSFSIFTYRVALLAVQAATVGLVWTSFHNALLLQSLPS